MRGGGLEKKEVSAFCWQLRRQCWARMCPDRENLFGGLRSEGQGCVRCSIVCISLR